MQLECGCVECTNCYSVERADNCSDHNAIDCGKNDNDNMFKLTVEFSTDNAAFEQNKKWEINRIINDIADYNIYRMGETYGKVMDSNGNTIGRWFLGDDIRVDNVKEDSNGS